MNMPKEMAEMFANMKHTLNTAPEAKRLEVHTQVAGYLLGMTANGIQRDLNIDPVAIAKALEMIAEQGKRSLKADGLWPEEKQSRVGFYL